MTYIGLGLFSKEDTIWLEVAEFYKNVVCLMPKFNQLLYVIKIEA